MYSEKNILSYNGRATNNIQKFTKSTLSKHSVTYDIYTPGIENCYSIIFQSRKNSIETKKQTLDCYIVSILIYGIDYWTITWQMKMFPWDNSLEQEVSEKIMRRAFEQRWSFKKNANNKKYVCRILNRYAKPLGHAVKK